MKDLFYMGGPLFMSILTVLLVGMVAWIIYHFILGMTSQNMTPEKTLRKLVYGKSMGLFAMITGILGQLIGFYMAFTAIQKAGDISPAMVFDGLKVSLITTIYGIFIYLLSILLWLTASSIIERKLK